ncbi:MAG: tetratricopeptide repeat protein [Gammaproteobacteria bacterium]|nr:tetratricopeptide repeat protein [Gammaproteobacteria bacterium]
MRAKRRNKLLAVLVAAGLGGAAQAALPVPPVDTAQLQPEIARRIEHARDYFARTRTGLEGTALGAAWGRLGMVYQAFRFQPQAGACYRNAIAADPAEARWHYYLGVHLEEVGELDAALASYAAALKRKPDYVVGHIRYGEVALEAQHLDAAQRAFEQALAGRPGLAAARAGLGNVALRRGQYRKAIEHFQAALAQQPEAGLLQYRMAQAWRHLGDTEKARAHLALRGERTVSVVDPWIELMKAREKGAGHFIALARQALAAKNLRRASGNLRLAVAIEPEAAEAYGLMAELLAMTGQAERARKFASAALRLAPGHPQAARWRELAGR